MNDAARGSSGGVAGEGRGPEGKTEDDARKCRAHRLVTLLKRKVKPRRGGIERETARRSGSDRSQERRFERGRVGWEIQIPRFATSGADAGTKACCATTGRSFRGRDASVGCGGRAWPADLHCSWRLCTHRAHHERPREGSEGAPRSSPALSARGESSADDHATRRLPVADSAMSGANIPPASAEDRGARSLDDMDFDDVFDGNRSPGNSPHRKSIAAAREVRPDSPEPSRTRRSRRTRATRLPPHPCDALFAHEPPALPPASRRLRAPRMTRPA